MDIDARRIGAVALWWVVVIAVMAAASPAWAKGPKKGMFILKGGGLLNGSGDTKFDCGNEDPACLTSETLGTEDKSGIGLAMEGLVPASPRVLLGGGLLYATSTTFKLDLGEGVGEQEFGSDLSIYAVAEYYQPVYGALDVHLRAMGGLFMLFPGDDWKDRLEACKECEEGPYLDWTGGLGAGFTLDVGSFGFRAELAYQLMSTDLVASDDARITTVSYSGWRLWAMGGVSIID